MGNELSFRLDGFEGPLDLLLHLISKNKFDIKDIKVADICDQYLFYLEQMKELDLEIAGEFLEMASRLLYLKSKMLLPSYRNEDEEDEDVADLVRMLEEYKRYKELTGTLKDQYETFSKLLTRDSEPIEILAKYEIASNKNDLLAALEKLAARVPKGILVRFDSFRGIVGKEPYPVTEKISDILVSFQKKTKLLFHSLFQGIHSRSEVVAVFLAVLELIKTDRVKTSKDEKQIFLVQAKSYSMKE